MSTRSSNHVSSGRRSGNVVWPVNRQTSAQSDDGHMRTEFATAEASSLAIDAIPLLRAIMLCLPGPKPKNSG
jgi:hypothetical protein